MKIDDTVRSFQEIVDGKHDDIPEQAFYMKGDINEVLEEAEKMKARLALSIWHLAFSNSRGDDDC